MGRHVIEPDAETRTQQIDRLRGNVRAALQEYVTAVRNDDHALILEWAAAVEYSTPDAERERKCGRLVVCQDDVIAQSTIEGLGLFMSGMSR